MKEVPADIQRIICTLLIQRMEVTGPTTSDGRKLYFVNSHALSENELRVFRRSSLLTSSEIMNYARSRTAGQARSWSGKFRFLIRCYFRRGIRLFWCKRFHRRWRRRVDVLPAVASVLCYEVRCLKCGMADIEIAEYHDAKIFNSRLTYSGSIRHE